MSAIAIPVLPAIRLKNILYAIDFSEASRVALPIVSAIARKYGSHVFAAHVRAPLPYSTVVPKELSALEGKEESAAREVLEKFVRIKELEGLPITPILKCGDAVKELPRIVHQHHINLAVLSTHGRTGFKRPVDGFGGGRTLSQLALPRSDCGSEYFTAFPRTVRDQRDPFPDRSFLRVVISAMAGELTSERAEAGEM